MRDWIRRNPFLSFYVLAIAFPTLLFAYLAATEALLPDLYGPGTGLYRHFFDTMTGFLGEHPLLARHRDSALVFLSVYALVPLAAPFLFFPLAPTLSAVLVTGLGRGAAAARALLGAFVPVRGSLTVRQGLRLYGLVLLTIAGIVAFALLLEWTANEGRRLQSLGDTWGLASPSAFASGWGLALLTNQGGLFEELGWRGYAWPVLARAWRRPLTAAALLGLAWALWHFPREIAPLLSGQSSVASLAVEQALFIGSCIGMTVVAVTFVNHSGGSVWPAIMIHGTLNFLYQGFEAGRTGVRSDISWEPTAIWLAAALAVLVLVGPDLGWRRRLQLHGGDGRSDPANLWAAPAATT